jgi:hypothetical protein
MLEFQITDLRQPVYTIRYRANFDLLWSCVHRFIAAPRCQLKDGRIVYYRPLVTVRMIQMIGFIDFLVTGR